MDIPSCSYGPSELPEEDDEIISEIPIFNSTRLQKDLYLLRYPLISKKCQNEMNIRRGSFKRNSQEMELEMSIDVESPNFDSDRAELIAQEANGHDKRKSTAAAAAFENDLVDKVLLKSSKTVSNPSIYAALVYTGKEIHLTTLRNIFQMKPSFSYLDRVTKRKDADHNDVSDEEEASGSNSAAEQITVKFKQAERWNSNKTDKKIDTKNTEEEPSISCEFHPEGTSMSKIEKLKLLAENTEETGQAMNLSDAEYLRVLVPKDEGKTTTEPSSPSHIMSLHTLRASPIIEQCRVLLKDAQIVQFQQLIMILAGGEGLTPDALLKTLPKVAILVRGNWVVKSDVLYPKDTFSSTSGVPAELMCRTRDYVLYLFTKNQYVERKKVSSMMKIPSEEVKEIFTGFSRLSHNKGWELVLPTDNDFIVKHHDIVQKQNDLWEQKFLQFSEFLKDNQQRRRRKSKSISDDSKMKTGNNYASSDNDSGTEKNKSPIAVRKNKK